MELLAPAGDLRCLEAAIEAGADAVYLGLSLLNARRGAKNFTPAELEEAVGIARDHDVATHLTLNIDISRREAGAAARILSMARDIGVDAVIVRDWAAVGLWRAMRDAAGDGFCPALHLSTQTALTNPEAARLAADVGASRVVLARELSLEEIQTIARARPELEIEVFAQGALCYSISGRCLMSSWGGGRSGNRGLCTSPCRVPWAVDGEAVGTAMSMRDLVTVDRLGELAAAGVDSIKIEGRLKKPEWVGEAVKLYRQALGPRRSPDKSGRRPDTDTMVRARRLAAYAGRETTSAYLDGNFSGLTGVAARKSARAASDAIEDFFEASPPSGRFHRRPEPEEEKDGYGLEISVTDKGLSCRCTYQGRSESWRMPKTKIRREKKAVRIDELFAQLGESSFGGVELGEHYSNEPDFMLPPRNVKTIFATVSAFINRLTGNDDDGSDAVMKAALPAEMRAALAAPEPDSENRRLLGERPNQVRVSVKQLNSSLLPVLRDTHLVLQNSGVDELDFAAKFVELEETTISFPDVYFPDGSAEMHRLAAFCRERNIGVEANCWGSLWLCREYGLRTVAGPGIPVLNHLAVKCLRDLGVEGVTVSMEADRRQIEDICAASPLPLTLIVYARPVLAYTRIPKGDLLPAGPTAPDGAWTDRRGISLQPEAAPALTVFRSLTAFDWKTLTNDKIRVANLAMDLTGESYPVDVWKRFLRPGGKRGFLFNYDRGLR